ncbi:uncharacterized protein B0H64DRAFT_394992 [Chaetomium fimeti]|uniref:Uncharacterized protein n=1 Tax=Chaetomium fimeti TaxID=1854472 RepID=A0AAE0HFA1_9PEZI|nr:hypothetical protein B0H64DRAFT_394992 [Chaetomium fimeti]
MSDRRFKTLLSKLSGLTIVAEELFLTDNDRLLVVARILDMHPADGPDQRLDKETLHDSLLKLMETCHAERDAMWFRSRMEPRFWMRVRASTPWAGGLDFEVLRTLALGLTQAAWAHFKDPKRNKNGDPQPCCKLAMASLQFASDINVYEGHLKPEKLNDMNFSEWRGLRRPCSPSTATTLRLLPARRET